jgi:hypothetical protein
VWPARRAGPLLWGWVPSRWRALDEIVRLDRRWFGAHPQRQHRCRRPDPCELALCDCERGARLVIAIRHLGPGYVVYQPVILQGALPAHEESAAALFALAATSPEPIPLIAQMDVRRLRCGLRHQTQSREASALVATKRWQYYPGRSCQRVVPLVLFGETRDTYRSAAEWRRGWFTFLTLLIALGVIVGMSTQAAAVEGFAKRPAGLLNIASEPDEAGSHNETGGQPGGSSWDPARNEPRLGKTLTGTGSKVGKPAKITNATSPGEPVAAPVSGRVVVCRAAPPLAGRRENSEVSGAPPIKPENEVTV